MLKEYNVHNNQSLISRLKKISEISSIIIVIIGFLVLIGWTFNISILKSPGPDFSTIKANVGLCFIFIGASLWLMQTKRTDKKARRIAQVLALLAALIGFFTLLEDLFHWNLGIDQILFSEAPGALLTISPNRMAVTVSTSLLFLGVALLLMDRDTKWGYRLSQLLSVATGFIALLGFLGYVYGVSYLYNLYDYTAMAIYASVTLILTAVSLTFAQPDKGPMGVITSKYMGGYLSQRLIPLTLFIPIMIGWIVVLGYNAGFFGNRYSISIVVVITAMFLMGTLWWIARSLNLIDDKREKLDENLKESEKRFKQVAESAEEWIWEVDTNGLYTYSNPILEKILGYTPEEVVGRMHFYDLFAPEYREELKKAALEAFAMNKPFRGFVNTTLHKNGTPVILETSGTPILDKENRLLGYRGADTNITQRKKAEQQLKKSNQYNRSLIEASLDPLVTIGPDGEITDTNQATEQATGHTRNQLIGTDFSNYFTQPPKAKEGYLQVFKEGFVRDYPLEIQHKNGTITPVLYNATIYKDETGQVIGVFAAARDITQLKKAEEELKKHRDTLEKTVQERTEELANTNEALEEEIKEHQKAEEELEKVVEELTRSNKDLEQFAYIASHDLQEPLRSVSGFLQLLSRRYHGKLDPKADQYIDIAVGGAGRMQTMIEDLLKFSRVTTRGEEFKPTDFETVLSDVSLDLKAIIEENDAIITHDPLPTIMADESQMKQLFQNLVANAIKFHGKNPPEVHISAEEKNSKWVFSVADNGIGIDPKYADRIFEVFKRLHTRRKYSGTGIGLAVSRKIVERHGGRIWVDSKPSEGSIFYFTIPKGG